MSRRARHSASFGLKGQSGRQNPGTVVRGRERRFPRQRWCDGELVSYADDEFDTVIYLESPEDDARREEYLVLAAPQTAEPVCVVYFELGPEIVEEVILECDVRCYRRSDRARVRGGIGIPIVAWISKSPQPLPPAMVGVMIQARFVKAGVPVGAVTPRKAVTI